MEWRKLYLTAIKALPEEWIDDETRITTTDTEVVFAANPKFPAMKFKDGKWMQIELNNSISKEKKE